MNSFRTFSKYMGILFVILIVSISTISCSKEKKDYEAAKAIGYGVRYFIIIEHCT